MTKIVPFPAAASQGHCFVSAVLRRAHFLSFASSTPPAHPTPVTKQATVVPFVVREVVAAPSLTGRKTVATPNTDGGDDAA